MKTFKSFFETICSFENLFDAYLKARKGKRYRNDVLEFSYNLEENLIELSKQLKNGTYEHGGYRKFHVYDQKRRLISSAPFKDRVVHHAICNIIEPMFEKRFISDSFSCRKKKGTHIGAKRLSKFVRAHSNKKTYVLKCDIRKYFDSMDHEILIELLERKIRDERVMWLLKEVIESSHSCENKGIPIGNLTSQLFANIYLNELDYFVKHTLKEKYYCRYVDDFVVLHNSPEKLRKIRSEIKIFLESNLKLKLHPKKQNIISASHGIDFLGYRIFESHRLLRKTNIKRFKKRLKFLIEMYNYGMVPFDTIRGSINSWMGYASHADSYGLRKSLLGELGVYLPFSAPNFKSRTPAKLRISRS